MPGTISRVTVYKLKVEAIDGLGFSNYEEVKDASYSLGQEQYPYKLFFLKQFQTQVDWFEVFNELDLEAESLQIPQKLNAGFIFVVKVNESFYGVTGGLGHIHLKKAVDIEHNFGIDIAEKILSLPELRGLAQKNTSGIVNSLDRVFRGRYNPNGDIDNLKRVLTHIRGKLNKKNAHYEIIGKSIQASDALSVNGTKSFREIIKFIIEVDRLWQTEEKKIKIPQLEFIDKKFYPELILTLEQKLIEAICSYSEEENSLFLDNDTIGYLPDRVTKYQLIHNRQKYDCNIYTEVFEQAVMLLNEVPEAERVSQFHRMSLRLFFDDDHQEAKELFYFICGDVTYDNDVFFINNKHWYRASDEFISRLNSEINNIEFIPPEQLGLLEWGSRFPDEGSYNEGHDSLICLDRKLVKVAAERGGIEFCDLLHQNGDKVMLLYVKNDCGAALRALFAQGFVSAKLYDEDAEFKSKVHSADLQQAAPALTDEQKQVLSSLSERLKKDMKIVYAIFDNTQSHHVSPEARATSERLNGTLTTFAKVDLLERVSSIRAMGYNVAVTRIKPYPVSN